MKIEDYAIIGNCRTAALVGRNGSIDWLCMPRLDAAACFAALLGTSENGYFRIFAPEATAIERRYRDDSMVLETISTTPTGRAKVIDCMLVDGERHDLIRVVEGMEGECAMRMELSIRFDYGQAVPWVQRAEGGIVAVAGPDSLRVRTDAELVNRDFLTTSELRLRAGQRVHFHLAWSPSNEPDPPPLDLAAAVEHTDAFWRDWASRCAYKGPHRQAVMRSLLVLKALTYAPTGGIAAAVTTSLPEALGGVRNWDYRFCWIRDATMTLLALLHAGYTDEAQAFERWLLRAAAGKPEQLQIMYGLAGERRLTEVELPELCGYEGSRPVRIGNLASTQRQLDVYGELMDAIHVARRYGIEYDDPTWRFQKALLRTLEQQWREVDAGLWEMRGPPRHFTHSKVMAWVAFDRAICSVERFGLDGPVDEWRATRAAIHEEVCARGFRPALGHFVQAYDCDELDASLLMIPQVGFLPPDDPRVVATVEAVQRRLCSGGLVARYTEKIDDGLPQGEGAFLACNFWLVDALVQIGRPQEAERMFDRLLALRNDVGLLAEEYDPQLRRQLGNFPQGFSHVGLVNAARNLYHADKPADERSRR